MTTPTPPPPAGTSHPAPTAPIEVAGGLEKATARLGAERVELPEPVVQRLRQAADVVDTDAAAAADASRDWWPLAMSWATEGQVAALAAAVVRPSGPQEVSDVLAICHEAGIPLTTAAGRSGVCGASVPLHGGVVLDMCGFSGIRSVERTSMVLDVAPGTFGDRLEHTLRTEHEATLGHWPQSLALSTVGGWLACRSAGQLSTRYGKIEDMVLGLDVALADGRMLHTGDHPARATGPDLTQLFVGSEGTLGVICGARFRLHQVPETTQQGAWLVDTFEDGLDTLRRVLHRGATPAVLRLYDPAEADRTYSTGGRALVLALDEGDPTLVEATMAVVATELGRPGASSGRAAEPAPDDHVEHWLKHRNEVTALEKLISKGYVVDTMEVSGSWSQLPGIYRATLDALESVEGTLAASAHQSHSYPTGGCLYFTFAGQVDTERRDAYYQQVWDAGQRAALSHGASLSHHHGVGLNRSRFMAEALGEGLEVMSWLKRALDPHGVLNPGKLGLPSPWGPVEGWS